MLNYTDIIELRKLLPPLLPIFLKIFDRYARQVHFMPYMDLSRLYKCLFWADYFKCGTPVQLVLCFGTSYTIGTFVQ